MSDDMWPEPKTDQQVLPDLSDLDIDDGVSTATYKHIYRTNFDRTYKRHDCLRFGAWCWKNAFERPVDIIRYFRKRR